eukprot:g1082.t1
MRQRRIRSHNLRLLEPEAPLSKSLGYEKRHTRRRKKKSISNSFDDEVDIFSELDGSSLPVEPPVDYRIHQRYACKVLMPMLILFGTSIFTASNPVNLPSPLDKIDRDTISCSVMKCFERDNVSENTWLIPFSNSDNSIDHLPYTKYDTEIQGSAKFREKAIKSQRFPGYRAQLIKNLHSIPKPVPIREGHLIDDHIATPIGAGFSLGVLDGSFQLDLATIRRYFPKELQKGFFSTNSQNGKFPAIARFSHTKVGSLDVFRLAVKIKLTEEKDIDLLGVETITTFPIANKKQLDLFFRSQDITASNLLTLLTSTETWKMKKNSDRLMKEGVRKGSLCLTPLGKTYHSLLPYQLGDSALFKFAFRPPQEQFERNIRTRPINDNSKTLSRMELHRGVRKQRNTFDLGIQLAYNEDQPLDGSKVWSHSKFLKIGTLTFPKQRLGINDVPEPWMGRAKHHSLMKGNNSEESQISSKRLSFKPGNAEHPPRGAVGEFRSYVYEHYDRARQEHLLDIKSGEPLNPLHCPYMLA